MRKIKVLGVAFNSLTMEQALELIEDFVTRGRSHLVITANPEMVMKARGDQLLSEIMDRADLVVADGIGVVWASQLLGEAVPERIPGIELAEGMLRLANSRGWRVFLLGGVEGVAEQAANALRQKMPNLQIVGTHHGFFQAGFQEELLLAQLKESSPHLLFTALGVPRQEKWLAAHLWGLQIPVAIGVGGSFNVWAGREKRAPIWLRKIHLEWLYRLLRQPWRLKRVAVLPKFMGLVLLEYRRRGR